MNLSNRLKCAWTWLPAEQRFPLFVVATSFVTALVFALLNAAYRAFLPAAVFLLLLPSHIGEIWLIIRKNQMLLATWMIMLMTGVYVTLGVLFVGGSHSPLFYWFALLPLVGALLLKRRGIKTGLICCLLGFFAIHRFESDVEDWMLLPDRLFVFLSFVIFIIVISLVSFQFAKTHLAIHGMRSRKLENLLSIVTHDIANPLTVINHNSRKLQRTSGDVAELRSIHRAVGIIQDILERVRTLSAINSGKIIAPREHAPLLDCYEKLRFIYGALAEEKSQRLVFDSQDLPGDLSVEADPVLLVNEVLGNIVSNAIKFSPPKSDILVRTRRGKKEVCIEVKDEGIGIPNELLPYIFDESKVTQRKGTEGETGTGFGLPLMKAVVAQWGGRVAVETRTGECAGTSFFVYLPEAGA